MDDPHVQQRVSIQFMLTLGLAAQNIIARICDSFGPVAYSASTIHCWIKKFREGRTSVATEKPTRRPMKLTEAKVGEIRALIEENGNISLRELSRRTGLGIATVHKCVRKQLELKKHPARWIPHFLTDQQKLNRVDACRENLRIMRRTPGALRRIVSGDESWMFAYDPASKRSTATWLRTNEPRPQKPRLERSIQKVMLVIFFDATGVLFREFVPDGLGIDGPLYLDIMRRLRNAIRRRRPHLWRSGNWYLHHDGAPAHRSLPVRRFLRNTETKILRHPSYSPDLAPADFWLFDKVKSFLKGQRFGSVAELCEQVDAVIGNITQDEFRRAFDRLHRRWRACVAAGGEYFE